MIAVDIALATYNGANFIRQQIESIQKQTYRNWRLIISDDNSSDDTVDIIKDMMSNDSRIYLVGNKRQGGLFRTLIMLFHKLHLKLCYYVTRMTFGRRSVWKFL